MGCASHFSASLDLDEAEHTHDGFASEEAMRDQGFVLANKVLPSAEGGDDDETDSQGSDDVHVASWVETRRPLPDSL